MMIELCTIQAGNTTTGSRRVSLSVLKSVRLISKRSRPVSSSVTMERRKIFPWKVLARTLLQRWTKFRRPCSTRRRRYEIVTFRKSRSGKTLSPTSRRRTSSSRRGVDLNTRTGRNGSRRRAEKNRWRMQVKKAKMNAQQHLSLPRPFASRSTNLNSRKERSVLLADYRQPAGSCGADRINFPHKNQNKSSPQSATFESTICSTANMYNNDNNVSPRHVEESKQ
mmetsp:Transcript_44558/g.107986  ORF Transcript_44558/g.107986 Transcript_44558/m.107986 type:complete len:224 (+) Transcript_44558:2388-3059(+)